MNFIKDGRYPITLQDIYRENPQTSFPASFDPRELGYEPVVPVAKPTYDPITQFLVELSPVHDGTRWLEVWEVRSLDAATVAVNQAREIEQSNISIKAQIAAIEATQARSVREAALTGNTTFLASIEAKIVALRSQLK